MSDAGDDYADMDFQDFQPEDAEESAYFAEAEATAVDYQPEVPHLQFSTLNCSYLALNCSYLNYF